MMSPSAMESAAFDTSAIIFFLSLPAALGCTHHKQLVTTSLAGSVDDPDPCKFGCVRSGSVHHIGSRTSKYKIYNNMKIFEYFFKTLHPSSLYPNKRNDITEKTIQKSEPVQS